MTIRSEHDAIAMLARDFEKQGYSISFAPDPATLPFQLPNYQPDFIASRGEEHLIIEVKSKSDSRSLEKYKEIAEIVSSQKNWHFLISTINESSDNGALALTNDDPNALKQLVKQLDLLFQSENYALALPYLWSAYISGMRIFGKQHGVPIDTSSDKSVLNYMYSLGEISSEEYSQSLEYLSLRNDLVHSIHLQVPKTQADEMRAFTLDKLAEWELIDRPSTF